MADSIQRTVITSYNFLIGLMYPMSTIETQPTFPVNRDKKPQKVCITHRI